MKYAPLSLGTLLILASALPAGCGDDPPALGGTKDPAGDGDDDKDTGGDGDGDEESCEQGDTMDCSCGDLDGARKCVTDDEGENPRWTTCECERPKNDGPGNPNMIPCKPGYYTGDFEGEYWSGVFDIGFGSVFPVPVVAKGGGGKGLNLTLEQTGEMPVEGQEFAPELGVKDGCVVGIADALGTEHPFVGTLKGDLDCKTGLFEGTLEGYYKLFGTDWKFNFKGPVSAQFNTSNQKLENGIWDVDEHTMTMNPPGGSGSWNAVWDADTNPNPIPPECAELINGSGGDADADT